MACGDRSLGEIKSSLGPLILGLLRRWRSRIVGLLLPLVSIPLVLYTCTLGGYMGVHPRVGVVRTLRRCGSHRAEASWRSAQRTPDFKCMLICGRPPVHGSSITAYGTQQSVIQFALFPFACLRCRPGIALRRASAAAPPGAACGPLALGLSRRDSPT